MLRQGAVGPLELARVSLIIAQKLMSRLVLIHFAAQYDPSSNIPTPNMWIVCVLYRLLFIPFDRYYDKGFMGGYYGKGHRSTSLYGLGTKLYYVDRRCPEGNQKNIT